MLRSAWNLVKPATIEKCFRHAGFSKTTNSFAPEESADTKTEPTFNEMFGKVSALLDCPTLSLNEYVAVDDNVCTAPIMTQKEIVEIVQNPNDSTYVDSDDESENGISDAVPVPSTSEMRKIIKSMRSYLNAQSNGEMDKTMDDLEQFVDNVVLKRTFQKKISEFFPKKE